MNKDFFIIHPDQLDNQKFIVTTKDTFAKGQIQGGKLFLSEFKECSTLDRIGLLGNKAKSFVFHRNNDLPSLKFSELDLDTMKRNEIDAPIVLNDDEPLEIYMNVS